MNLAEDRRARVPFALVGVLLLVGSATLSANLVGGPTPRTDESVGTAMDRATAATNTALRGAVTRAGRRAASEPVTEPANTTAGNVLNDSTPYRDYLRIRIYLAAREALDSIGVRVGGVEGSVSLPATPNASALRTAKRRVDIEPAGAAESSGLRVRVQNVTVTARRGGQVVERTQISPTLVVATPTLALHERTERFESRLNRGPLAPGLGRRLTARLYPVAWARGYAQYGSAPIENVVANRHVELATNGAVLREQRIAFGRSDPRGRRALAWATARVGATDLLAAAHSYRGTRRTELLLAAANRYRTENPMPGGVTETNRRQAVLRVGVNRTADRAFADLVTGETGDSQFGLSVEGNGTDLGGILGSAYTVEARIVAAVRKTQDEERPSPEPPRPLGPSSSPEPPSPSDPSKPPNSPNSPDSSSPPDSPNHPSSPSSNWTLEDSHVRTMMRIENASGPPPGTSPGWHRLGYETRRVVRTHVLVANWSRGNETRQTAQRWSETFVVSVGIAGDHSADVAPDRPVVGVHERQAISVDGRADELGDPNLRDVRGKASEQLVADRGGFDALARRAVVGTLDTRPQRVSGRRPSSLRRWVYRDLVALRERVRNVSVTASPESAVGGQPPAAKLAGKLRSQRDALVGVPDAYEGVADRARVAARAAYLDRVLARLDARAARANETRSGMGGVLDDAGSSLDRARRILRERATPQTPPPAPMSADGPGSAVELSVAGGPPYLTLAALDHEQVAAIPEGEDYHPLSARNVNVFAVPYGDAANAVTSALDGNGESKQTDLRTAALALRAANRTLEELQNETLERRRDDLQESLAASMAEVRRTLVAQLAMSRFDLTLGEREAAVRTGLARWSTTAERALAVANGSAADAIAKGVLRQRPSLRRMDRRDWVQLKTELAVEATRRSVDGPPRSAVNRTGTTARRIARTAAEQALGDTLGNATERASDRWFGEVLGSVPAGLPVAPVPGYWYATVNVWTVSVRGQYARFSVRAPQGPPGESVVYTRQSGVVRLDVDGDGDDELLGRTEPISFETETVVVVVVPPGPPGVGDRDGNRDERSPGWNRDEGPLRRVFG